MDFNVKKDVIHFNDVVFENNSEQLIDGDITMPDYCRDIKKIMKCIVTPRLMSASCTGDRVTIEGNALVQVIYVSDENRICCYDKTFPFSKTVEIGKQIDNPCVQVLMKNAYTNTRAVSQRRIDIHAAIAVFVKITCKREENVVTDAENCGIQLWKNDVAVNDCLGDVVRTFSVNEVVEVGNSKPPILQIVRSCAHTSVSEIKVISNKILIKGDLTTNTLYCGDAPESKLESIEHTMPISQIIDFDGIAEDSICSVKLSITNLEVMPKSNSDGEKSLLDISATVTATITAEKNTAAIVPSDCYSTQYDVHCSKKNMIVEHISENIDETFVCKSSEALDSVKVAEICNIWCVNGTCITNVKDNAVLVKGTVTACILGIDEDGNPFYSERPIDYEKTIALKCPCQGEFRPVLEANVTNCSYVLGSNNQIEIRAEVNISGHILCSNTISMLTDIQINEEDRKQNKAASLTIYFSDAGEMLWNIARKFNTTVDAIKQENELSGDVILAACMLLIPSA